MGSRSKYAPQSAADSMNRCRKCNAGEHLVCRVPGSPHCECRCRADQPITPKRIPLSGRDGLPLRISNADIYAVADLFRPHHDRRMELESDHNETTLTWWVLDRQNREQIHDGMMLARPVQVDELGRLHLGNQQVLDELDSVLADG